MSTSKPVDVVNTEDAKKKVPDIKVIGDPDMWVLISKASSQSQNWMKSTKAMEIAGIGVVIQVSTQVKDNVAEALIFVPGAKLYKNENCPNGQNITLKESTMSTSKPVDVVNTEDAKKKVPDIKVIGDPDMWVLISKASSQSQGWMKSTKAMEIAGIGVVIQVSTQVKDNVAEALIFVPGAKLYKNENGNWKIVPL